MSNVTALKGAAIPGDVSDEVIGILEQLLDEAKRGEIHGLAYTASVPNGDTRNGWAHVKGGGHQLSTGILILSHDYARAWIDTGD